ASPQRVARRRASSRLSTKIIDYWGGRGLADYPTAPTPRRNGHRSTAKWAAVFVCARAASCSSQRTQRSRGQFINLGRARKSLELEYTQWRGDELWSHGFGETIVDENLTAGGPPAQA